MCVPTFTAALFIIVEIWKLPKCSRMDEWIKKMPRTHTTIIQLLKEGNLSYMTTWMSLKDMMLSETSQSQKDKHYKIPLL